MNGQPVFIVVLHKENKIILIESVWSSRELAKAAILFHSARSNINVERYVIIERIVNVTYK